MRILLFSILLALSTGIGTANAQVGIGIGVGPRFGYGGFGGGFGRSYGRSYPGRNGQKREQQPKFTPIVHVSFGYGFPNLDNQQLASFYNYSRGTATQTGPVTGAIDVQYSKTASIGLVVTHGQVSANYYDFNNLSGPPVFNGSLDNWSVMLNFRHEIPVSNAFSAYIRTAFGVNSWNQQYTDGTGNKLALNTDPSLLAYQIGLGGMVHLTKNAGLFAEAGYGKYILHGGISFKL